MGSWSRWIGIGASIGIVSALVPIVHGNWAEEPPTAALAKLSPKLQQKPAAPPNLAGLDLLHMEIRGERVVAPLQGGREAELTVDPVLQRAATAQIGRYRLPEAGLLLMDVKTGRLLVYASGVNGGEPYDVNTRALPPAASVFKVITGAALVERAGLNASTEQCYHGGRSRIAPDELEDNPSKDRWCVTLGQAMGRSINVVFGRLAQKHLTPEDLERMGGAFGFGAPVPFAVRNDAPKLQIPENKTDFARTAAGFWNTTLSPLAAVSLGQTVAARGVALEPRIVDRVVEDGKVVWQDDAKPIVIRRAIRAETATELTRMMLETVENGSARTAFRDAKGDNYLPGISVAGKTGTLSDNEANHHYTWFVGFAPADQPEIAVAALVVNNPSWRIKAPMLARNMLRAYFAKAGRRGVSMP
jgi:cell division protein FtsI/penicillin-binding protein 2